MAAVSSMSLNIKDNVAVEIVVHSSDWVGGEKTAASRSSQLLPLSLALTAARFLKIALVTVRKSFCPDLPRCAPTFGRGRRGFDRLAWRDPRMTITTTPSRIQKSPSEGSRLIIRHQLPSTSNSRHAVHGSMDGMASRPLAGQRVSCSPTPDLDACAASPTQGCSQQVGRCCHGLELGFEKRISFPSSRPWSCSAMQSRTLVRCKAG